MDPTTIEADNARLLERCILFHALGDESRRDLAARAHRRSFKAGEPIFHAGDAGLSMMAVFAGTVRISLTTPQGRKMILADLSAGEPFGEIALLDGRARSADATALGDCEVLVLDRADFLPLLERRPEVCLGLLELLCARLRRFDERMADIAFFDVAARLAKALLGEAARSGRNSRGAKLALSLAALADVVGGTRENVDRQLREWHRRGVVELREGGIVLIDPDALAAVAAQG